jgi:hypothetical protein
MAAKHEVNEVHEAVTQTTDPAGSPSCLMNVLFRGGSLKTTRCAAFPLCFSFFFVEKNRRNCCYTAIVKKRVWLSLCHSCTQHPRLTYFFLFSHTSSRSRINIYVNKIKNVMNSWNCYAAVCDSCRKTIRPIPRIIGPVPRYKSIMSFIFLYFFHSAAFELLRCIRCIPPFFSLPTVGSFLIFMGNILLLY